MVQDPEENYLLIEINCLELHECFLLLVHFVFLTHAIFCLWSFSIYISIEVIIASASSSSEEAGRCDFDRKLRRLLIIDNKLLSENKFE